MIKRHLMLDLRSLLEKYPQMRVATPADNGAILEFFDRPAISGRAIRLRGTRSPDFFKLLRYQSDRFTALLYERRGHVLGVASLSHRRGYVNGEAREIHDLGEFRMAFDREAIKAWRTIYAQLLAENLEPNLTAVTDENARARNALVTERPRHARFRYELLQTCRRVNVLGRAPWAWFVRNRPGPYSFRKALSTDRLRLENFLDRQARRRAFGYCFAEGELARRLRAWDRLKETDFILSEDARGELVGCFAPWAPAAAMYLTHLELDFSLEREARRELFGGMFRFFSDAFWDPRRHGVSFCDFPSLDLGAVLKRDHLVQELPMSLFTVRHADASGWTLDKGSCLEPGFEIALA